MAAPTDGTKYRHAPAEELVCLALEIQGLRLIGTGYLKWIADRYPPTTTVNIMPVSRPSSTLTSG
jgi:hypothetical protein